MHQSHCFERTSLLGDGAELIVDEGIEVSLLLFVWGSVRIDASRGEMLEQIAE